MNHNTPDYETAEYKDGESARYECIAFDANPYQKGSESFRSWENGWVCIDREIMENAAENTKRHNAHFTRYRCVAGRLSEIGIDAHELRDYLAGLPK
jgi:hypothetical protein